MLMVSWGWIPLCLFIGVCIGIFLLGLVSLNDHQEEQEQEYKDKKSRWYQG